MKRVPSILVIYFDAASGHRSAAAHLVNALNADGEERAAMVNLTTITDQAPRFGRIVRTGIRYFNWLLRRDWLFDLGGLINLSLLFHDTLSPRTLRRMSAFWQSKHPKMVVSVTPMYNPALIRSLHLVHPDVPFLCIPVDMDERKSRYWFTPEQPIYYACASQALFEKASGLGIGPDKLFRLSGMPASLSGSTALNKEELFNQWGFHPAWPVCFVSFGGQGTVEVLRIAREAERQKTEANFMFFCGKNTSLYNTLISFPFSRPCKVFSYLPHAPTNYLALADLVLGKPGAMTLAESQLAGVPLLALKSRGLKLVQRGNEDYIRQNALGDIFPTIRTLVGAIPGYRNYQNQLQRVPPNKGLTELVEICLELTESIEQTYPVYDKTLNSKRE